jgi:hypothetical protein
MADKYIMQATNQIAHIILTQLGGHKFIVMTGSKHFVALSNGLRFGLAKNITSANRCSITLTAWDLYEVVFYRATLNRKTLATSTKEIARHTGIYADQLQDIFTTVTGLYTSLGTMGR